MKPPASKTTSTHRVRDAVILALASAATLSCLLTAVLHRPSEKLRDPAAESATAEAEALRKLEISIRVSTKLWLKDHLKDPRSLEIIQWTVPAKTAEGFWTVSVKYRARNSFGGMTLEARTFTLDPSANVIGSRPVPPHIF